MRIFKIAIILGFTGIFSAVNAQEFHKTITKELSFASNSKSNFLV